MGHWRRPRFAKRPSSCAVVRLSARLRLVQVGPGRVVYPGRGAPCRGGPGPPRHGAESRFCRCFYFLKYMYSSWNWNCVSDAYAFGLPDIVFFHT